jgi:galactokinase
VINPPLRLLAAIQKHFDDQTPQVYPVPGRDMWVAGIASDGHPFHLIAHDLDSHTSFDRRSARQQRTLRNRPLPRWARYPAAALLVLSDEGIALPGSKLMLLGDEAAGPRYEHALGMACALFYLEQAADTPDVARLLEIMEQAQKRYLDDLSTY